MEEIFESCGVDPWFLYQIKDLVLDEAKLKASKIEELNKKELLRLKRKGFSDKRIADLLNVDEIEIRDLRTAHKVHPTFKRVDSCAAEFESSTNYLYSTYDFENESIESKNLSTKGVCLISMSVSY